MPAHVGFREKPAAVRRAPTDLVLVAGTGEAPVAPMYAHHSAAVLALALHLGIGNQFLYRGSAVRSQLRIQLQQLLPSCHRSLAVLLPFPLDHAQVEQRVGILRGCIAGTAAVG